MTKSTGRLVNFPSGQAEGNARGLDLRQARSQLAAEVRRTLTRAPAVIRTYTAHLADTAGKMLRGNALLICAMDHEDRIDPDAVQLACAMELIHLATLVHDDIMDDAEVRRGLPSLQKKYGRRTAVICGDYLLATALRQASLTRSRAAFVERDIPDYVSKVCMGELSQHIHNGNFHLSTYRYLKIIAGKTAALFAASFHGGALLAEAGEEEVARYARLGRTIGMIFQLTDDCLDYEATEEETGKPVRSDYEQQVFTLPLLYAFRHLEGFLDRAKAGTLPGNEVNEAVKAAGGLAYTYRLAAGYRARAQALLASLDLTAGKRSELQAILDRACRLA